MALFLAAGIVAAAPLLGTVPVASLVGVMLLVCQQTFSWSSLRLLNKIPRLDAAVIALVSFVTVQRDLAQAVLAGTITSALGFAWKQSTVITADTKVDAGNCKTYTLHGPLFFGSTSKFNDIFDLKSDPEQIVIDFEGCRVMDHSALDAIQGLIEKYQGSGKSIGLINLSKKCQSMLTEVAPTATVNSPSETVNGSHDETKTIKILTNK
jgi:SulP family sulfate permease